MAIWKVIQRGKTYKVGFINAAGVAVVFTGSRDPRPDSFWRYEDAAEAAEFVNEREEAKVRFDKDEWKEVTNG